MGFCHDDMPELFTSFLFEDISSWVNSVAEPFTESSICEEYSDADQTTRQAGE